jgi:hypothetical protein
VVTETGWVVALEFRGPKGAEPLATSDERLDRLAGLLAAHRGSVAGSGLSMTTTVVVHAGNPLHAVIHGVPILTEARFYAGLPLWPLHRLEVACSVDHPTGSDEGDETASRGTGPELAGQTEVLE